MSAHKACNRVIGSTVEKRCSQCQKWFPRSSKFFHRKGDRFHSECKACVCPPRPERTRNESRRGRKPAPVPKDLDGWRDLEACIGKFPREVLP